MAKLRRAARGGARAEVDEEARGRGSAPAVAGRTWPGTSSRLRRRGRYGPASAHSVEGAGILDVAPTVLELMGVPAPGGMEGRPIELISKEGAFPRPDRTKYRPVSPHQHKELLNESHHHRHAPRLARQRRSTGLPGQTSRLPARVAIYLHDARRQHHAGCPAAGCGEPGVRAVRSEEDSVQT